MVDEPWWRDGSPSDHRKVSLRLPSHLLTKAEYRCRYHGEGYENHEIMHIEMEEISSSIETMGSDKA